MVVEEMDREEEEFAVEEPMLEEVGINALEVLIAKGNGEI